MTEKKPKTSAKSEVKYAATKHSVGCQHHHQSKVCSGSDSGGGSGNCGSGRRNLCQCNTNRTVSPRKSFIKEYKKLNVLTLDMG